MNDTKRLIRRVSRLPARVLTEWEQGAIYGAMYGNSVSFEPVLQRLEAKLQAHEAKFGAVQDLIEAA